MPVTATKNDTLQQALDRASPDQLADALRRIALAKVLDPVKVTFVGLASAAAQNITTAAARAAATINQGLKSLGATDLLPAILEVGTLRVTAGTLAAGPAIVTDSGGTPTAIGAGTAHVATLSDDGTTLTFQAAVTAFVLEYVPRSSTDFATLFAPNPKA